MTEDDYLPYVRRIARRVKRRAWSVDLDDLVSVGCVALLKAVAAYDPARGTPLETFASYRVRGAMLDYLRDLDPLSRSERHKLRESGEGDPVVMCPLADAGHLPAPDDHPALKVLGRELRQRVHGRERRIVEAHYWEDRLLCEVADELGVSPCRVSQLHQRALDRLREAA